MIDWSKANWRKSTRSGGDQNCVMLARVGDVIGIRDSKDPTGPVLEFNAAEMAAFVGGIKDGEFDRHLR
jgi:hypothetical protein